MLRISRQSAYAAVHNGELPTIRLGRRLLVPKVALERMLGISPENGETPGTSLPSARETTSGAADAGHVVQAY
jgi:excisionase family DNA binding protein